MSYSRSNSEIPVVALDNGSCTCRLGFAGDDAPKTVFANTVGSPLFNQHADGDELYVGDKAQRRREVLSLRYPVERGIVKDWQDMEKIWQHGLTEGLGVLPTEHSVITSEPPLNPTANAETMAQVMFESFQVPGLFIGYEPHDILFAYGRGSAVLVSLGHGVSFAASIYEGQGPVSECRLDFGGQDLTNYLQHLLLQRGFSFTTSGEMSDLADMKQKAFVTAGDRRTFQQFESRERRVDGEHFSLPDGSTLELQTERFLCPELLFQPDGRFHQGVSITEMVHSCLREGCASTRRDLAVNILLSGGTSLCPGLPQRLKAELEELCPPTMRVKVIEAPERLYSSWIGKSIYGSLSYFSRVQVTREQYEECGPVVAQRRVLRNTDIDWL